MRHPYAMRYALAFVVLAGPAWAETCPAAPDHAAAQAEIYARLRALPSPVGAQDLSGALWQLWMDAPDDLAQALLDEGMRQRASFDLLGARDTLDQLVDYCPDYAEGYNQRAFASFLRADYGAALYDLDAALALSPEHTGALTGKALTLIRLGRDEEAQEVLRAAIALNPWLSERALLDEPAGQDI